MRTRVDGMTVCLIVARAGGEPDVVFEVEAGNPDLLTLLQDEMANYEVKPSLEFIAHEALEALSITPHDGPDGVRHTMDQIQDWYHRRWVHPYARGCKVCSAVKTKHGPSWPCKQFTEEVPK